MNRYKKIFRKLNQNKLGAFVPFITIGDPNPVTFMNIIDMAIQSGSDALELGIPFSDPVADGLSIQKSMIRSCKAGTNFFNSLKLIKTIRNKYQSIPIGLLVYANLVFKNGIDNFYKTCATLSIDSVLIPDLPIEESYIFQKIANFHNIFHTFICPPNATKNLIHNIISKNNNGYIYLVSRPGVTGKNSIDKKTNYTILSELISNIKKNRKSLPILQGFGIYTPSQACISVKSGTSGIIVGSAIADIIEQHYINTLNIELLLQELKKLIQSMKIAMKL